MKVLNQLFKVLSWLAIAVIVAYLAIAAPILLGYRPMVVLSGSMEPTYRVGSVIYYHECSFEELQVGDPITFSAGESVVTHRIVTVNGLSRTVITKGDHNESEDTTPVKESEIEGKATEFCIPYAGYFVAYGKRPLTIAILAAILLINYVLEKVVSKQRYGEERYEQKQA